MENFWNLEKTKTLFALAEETAKSGQSLTVAFEKMATLTGQSVGSVRNYYYAQAKLFKMMPSLATAMGVGEIKRRSKPFDVFTEQECRLVLLRALSGKAEGKSVRLTLWEMADGDKRIALRLQNKYRSLLAHHRSLVEQVMVELEKSGKRYFDPYSKTVVNPGNKRGISAVLDKISTLSPYEKEALLRKILS